MTFDPAAAKVQVCDFTEPQPAFQEQPVEQARQLLQDDSRLIWLDMPYEEASGESTLRTLTGGSDEFQGLKPDVAVRREMDPSDRPPKAKVFHRFVFGRTYMLDMQPDQLIAQEVHLLAGRTFAITIRYPTLAWSLERMTDPDAEIPHPVQAEGISPDHLRDAVLDFQKRVPRSEAGQVLGLEISSVVLDKATDSVFNALDALRAKVDEAELEVLRRKGEERPQLDTRMLGLRRLLRCVRWAIMPPDEVSEFLAGPFRGVQATDAGIDFRFNDLGREADRAVETVKQVDSQLERAVALRDSMKTDQLNRTIYVLTLVTTVLLVPTLIAGLYGMNFGNLPGFGTKSGYWWVLATMVVLSAAVWLSIRLYLRPRRRRSEDSSDSPD